MAQNTQELVMIEYYTKDEDGELLREYGEVSTDEIETRDGYDLPVLIKSFN